MGLDSEFLLFHKKLKIFFFTLENLVLMRNNGFWISFTPEPIPFAVWIPAACYICQLLVKQKFGVIWNGSLKFNELDRVAIKFLEERHEFLLTEF
jgi:hypothetical protein